MPSRRPPCGSKAHEPEPGLPSPASQRWRPLRAGLLNLYRYDEQVFHFEQGRLLLRGNNGTGKSRVLALQLPFLLDADIAPQRVEPDGDIAKRIEWNLLMNRYPDRLGYTWLEFGRVDEQAVEHYFTIGIALQATAGRGAPTRWYFILRNSRVGVDLDLRNERDQPLSRDALAERIGEAGEVIKDRDTYRRAVDAELFKLGDARYRALMDLLIQLRQPQLSRDLDERRLSAALSEALPPIERRIVEDVAESFRGLESDRLDLQRSEAAGEAAEAFLRQYGPYVRCAARRRAGRVRSTHSDYEQAQRELRAAEEARDAASAALDQLTQQLAELTEQIEAADATVRTLASSPEMRAAESLDAAHTVARTQHLTWQRCRGDHEEAIRRRDEAAAEFKEAQRAVAGAEQELRAASTRAADAAADAGLHDQHAAALAAADTAGADALTNQAVDAIAGDVERIVAHRQQAIRRVAALIEAVQDAAAQVRAAKQRLDDQQTSLNEAREAERIAAETLAAEGRSLLDAYRDWAQTVSQLLPVPVDDLADTLAAWCETGEGQSPVRQAVEAARVAAQDTLAGDRAKIEQKLRELHDRVEQLHERRDALAAGRHTPPAPPYTRGVDARPEQQAGAPLWALVEFVGSVLEADRAGFEAALEAAGLLDAWVTPDGRLLDADTLDTCLVADGSPLPEDAPRLSDILQRDATAADSAEVAEQVLRDVLMRIGLGPGSAATWVNADGTWGNGPLHGRWAKPAAQHIGQAARERHRLQQIDALDARITEADASAGELRSEIDAIDQRIAQARQEAQEAPDDEVVRKALAERTAAGRNVAERRGRVADAERRVHERRQALRTAEAERDRDAADLGLTEWIDRLDELREATGDYRHATAQLWPALRRSVDARRIADRSSARAAEADQQAHTQANRLHAAAAELRAAEAHRDTLEASIGKSARDIRSRLEEARHHTAALQKEHKAKGEEDRNQRIALAVARKEIETHTAAMNRHHADRAEAIESLASLARLKLLSVVAPDLAHDQGEPASVSRAVDLARQIESRLTDVPSDDESWARHQREVHRHIQNLTDALLPHDLRPQTTTIDDLLVVTVIYDQRDCTMPELQQALAEDAQARRAVLEEQERRVLEQTLIDEVATHLHDRLHEAERLVAGMNEQITSRPMSTGMRIKFVWEPLDDGPSGLGDARRRLLGAGATWSPDDRAALGRFLHEQIQAARTANDTATWQQHIEEAFDYRRWHRFAVMRQQDGKWQRLTRRTHGTGSGGEKAVALTLPMFAAAAAHYQSADPLAPRPILLDEVFAGIDSDMRGKCMGLLDAFDLNFIMTSEREWGCYAEMPGVAIYQLTTMKGIDAVLATRWLWNGRQRTRSEPPPLDNQPATPEADSDGLLL